MKVFTAFATCSVGHWMRLFGPLLAVVVMVPAVVLSQAPALDSPANAAVDVSTSPTLSWFAAAGDSVYHLQIDSSATFGSTAYDDSTLTGVSHAIPGLRNATTYYWRVSVKDSASAGGGTSAYSTARNFTTWAETPVTPQLPVTLGLTGRFAILSYAAITNTGPSVITGDVGVSPLAASNMSGFDASNVVGTIYGADATGPSGSIEFPSLLTQAMGDLTIAFDDAAGRTVAPIGVSGNLGGQTLYPGLYKSNSALEVTAGDLTLDAQGDENAVWIFQIASDFNMTTDRQVFLSGGAKASNIFWQVGSSATFGTTTVMKGTILAYAGITFATGASLEGRALARTEAVTLQTNVIGGTLASPLLPGVFLGTAANFKVLAGTKIINTGFTSITGDIGVSPGTEITGFPPGTFGVQYPGDATSAAAQVDLHAAYDSTVARTADSTLSTDLGGITKILSPGVYAAAGGTFVIVDTLTLDGGGDASAIWVFKMSGALTTATDSYVNLTNGAQWYNVFWQVGSSAILGVNSSFRGTLMAFSTITANDGAAIGGGRLLALTDSVLLNNNAIGGAAVVTTVRKVNIPEGFTLAQNYPNPFNPSTMIEYSLEKAAQVSLKVYNVLGREVATLVNGRQEAGSYTVAFNANKGTSSLSSGVYFYRLEAGSFISTKKLILMK
ncbi:MAG: ice-binding family protein [Bacteroidota bacterium]